MFVHVIVGKSVVIFESIISTYCIVGIFRRKNFFAYSQIA